MPTDALHRILEGKRDRLVRAIQQELSSVPVAETSIDRIVHQAAISRGGFCHCSTDRAALASFLIGSFFAPNTGMHDCRGRLLYGLYCTDALHHPCNTPFR